MSSVSKSGGLTISWHLCQKRNAGKALSHVAPVSKEEDIGNVKFRCSPISLTPDAESAQMTRKSCPRCGSFWRQTRYSVYHRHAMWDTYNKNSELFSSRCKDRPVRHRL